MLNSGIFRTHVVEYTCNECQNDGVFGVCVHRRHRVPAHISESGALEMALFKNDENVAREAFGVIIQRDDKYVYPQTVIGNFFTDPRIRLNQSQRFIFLAIDPCSGTDDPKKNPTSDFCIVSIAGNQDIILGIDSIPIVRASDYKNKMLLHFKKLIENPLLKNSTFVVDIEGNGSLEWDHIQNELANEVRPIIFMNDYIRKWATNTTDRVKEEGATTLKEILSRKSLGIWENFHTSGNEMSIMVEFERQIRTFERIKRKKTSATTAVRFLYSGKGPNGDNKDDIAVTLQRVLRARARFYTSDQYSKYH